MASDAAVALVEAFDGVDDATHERVVAALERLGPPRAADLDLLMALLRSPTLDTAYWAAMLIGCLESEAAPAVPGLVEALGTHPELAVRQRSAWALGQVGPAAAAARATLQTAASSSDARLASLARGHQSTGPIVCWWHSIVRRRCQGIRLWGGNNNSLSVLRSNKRDLRGHSTHKALMSLRDPDNKLSGPTNLCGSNLCNWSASLAHAPHSGLLRQPADQAFARACCMTFTYGADRDGKRSFSKQHTVRPEHFDA
jgi:HEAT repeat protein